MIITDYYRFVKLATNKSKMRMDCKASTHSYPKLECMRNKQGQLFVYCGNSNHTKAGQELKASLALTKTEHITSIYVPDLNKPLGYGDVRGTTDALLFRFDKLTIGGDGCTIYHNSTIEVFVVRGQKRYLANLYTLLAEGELDEEIEAMRAQATADEDNYPTIC